MAKRKVKHKVPCQVIIPVNHPNPPEQHEVDVATILANHYLTTVEFIVPYDGYKRKTPDIRMLGVEWEIKSPSGASRVTISGQFQRASKQAKNIVIDSRRTKLKYEEVERRVLYELKKRSSFKKAILINKFGKVVEVKM